MTRPEWTVASDLHLFAARSRRADPLETLASQARDCGRLILNGDIFDFDWSVLASAEATVDAADRWLNRLLDACDGTPVSYLLGNHDCLRAWAERLDRLSREHPGLEWSPDYIRYGDTLFTHGDLLLGQRGRPRRELVDSIVTRRRTTGRLYALATATGAPRAVGIWFGATRCARTLRRNLRDLDPELTQGVRRLFVGHTHHPFTGVRAGDIEVSNTGSNIRGMRFNVLRFSSPEPEA